MLSCAFLDATTSAGRLTVSPPPSSLAVAPRTSDASGDRQSGEEAAVHWLGATAGLLGLVGACGAARRASGVGPRRRVATRALKTIRPVAISVTVPAAQTAYRGVTWHARSHRWQAHVDDPATGAAVSLGHFGAEREAAKAFDCAMIVLEGRSTATNFEAERYTKAELEAATAELRDFWRPRPSATYHGVYQTRGCSKWKAEIELYDVKQFIGEFEEEETAARALDNALRSTGAERVMTLQYLNFKQASDYFSEDQWEEEKVPRGATSRFLGVSYHQRSSQYVAKLGRRHIGVFASELEAAQAFDEASGALGGLTNFQPPALNRV